MERLLNFGVSAPLTLGMTHPVADRIETLGRARPTTWFGRLLGLSAMSAIALSTAPLSIAASEAAITKGHRLTVIPDMSEAQLVDLQSRLNSLKSGQADKSIITEFMMNNDHNLMVKFDAEDKVLNLTTSAEYGFKRAKAELDLMPKWLELCKAEKLDYHVIRVSSSYGFSSVQCGWHVLPKPEATSETK